MCNKHATTRLSFNEVCRRAGGRRRINRHRKFLTNLRLAEVGQLLQQTGFTYGYQTKIAQTLGVHRSTVCRDLQRLRLREMYGSEADKMLFVKARAARQAREESKREQEREQDYAFESAAELEELVDPTPTLSGLLDQAPKVPETQRATPQVPMWLSTSRSELTSRIPLPVSGGASSRHKPRR
ncbi:MAG: hypothetical protein ACYC3X_24680 [Pirellulaceae bacterium]